MGELTTSFCVYRICKIVCSVGVIIVVSFACSNENNFISQTAGVYQGKEDPLLTKQKDESQQQLLKERFHLVQTDR